MLPATPIATAPASPTTASVTSVGRESAVRNGRPLSSSSACALTPTARENATKVQPSRLRWSVGAAAAPSAT